MVTPLPDAQPVDRSLSEQRASPRRLVTLRCRVADGRVERHTRMVDISIGGARIATATPPPVGWDLAVSFRLRSDGPEVSAVATVVWRAEGFRGRGGLMGVEFSSVSHPREVETYTRAHQAVSAIG